MQYTSECNTPVDREELEIRKQGGDIEKAVDLSILVRGNAGKNNNHVW